MADELITKAVIPYGARVCPKVGLKDILDISNSGIGKQEYSYALKAHIDFCVINSDDYVEFGVEIDEKHHLSNPEDISKDKLKNELCSKLGLPLLRISNKSLKRIKKLELIAWLVSYYFAFRELSKNKTNLGAPRKIQSKLSHIKETMRSLSIRLVIHSQLWDNKAFGI
ncbi:DUF2726 domain-containing protein [Neosynechococcus sphagnicola]|uniref:DUF2726 domain-containing protein n=1 Tax=Neosynechococcus sphagnicola TaxID=1501145 RepID=UPI00138E249D|nr:DUF2726 domain-containing protein [Neosynechococcus sphagnicola]